MHCDITLKVGQIQYFETKRNRKSNQIKTSQIYASNLINTISFLNCLTGSTVKSARLTYFFRRHQVRGMADVPHQGRGQLLHAYGSENGWAVCAFYFYGER
jgi:hypothetical protein